MNEFQTRDAYVMKRQRGQRDAPSDDKMLLN